MRRDSIMLCEVENSRYRPEAASKKVLSRGLSIHRARSAALAAEVEMPRMRFDAAPVLETERLLLRGHDAGDFADCVAMWSEPVVVRYTIGDPSPASRTWLRMLGYRGHWGLLGFGYWAVQEKSSGRYVGELGFADFKRDIRPSIEGMPELGWALAPWAHGKGYATEALKAAVAWGDLQFTSPRTACIIHRDNQRSFRVADRLGYKEVLRTPTDAEPSAILVRAVGGTAGCDEVS